MNELYIYFEVTGIAFDQDGNPCPAGMKVSLGKSEKQIDYAGLTRSINIPNLLRFFKLDQMVKPEDVKIISPEEYDIKYGEGSTRGDASKKQQAGE